MALHSAATNARLDLAHRRGRSREGLLVASDLQLLVDQLSVRVGAAALLEDHEQRTVAYSRQVGPIDPVRRDSILHRATSPELMRWFRNFGILGARHALRIPAHPELDILARVCAPAWYRDRLFGFLWLIDTEGAIGASQLAEIEKAADQAALMLYEERLAQRLAVQALTHLLSPSEELRDAAADQLVGQSLLREGEPTAVVVVQQLPPSDANITVLEEALLDVGWEAPTGALLRLACSDHGVLLVRLRSLKDDSFATAMAKAGQETLSRRLSDGSGAAPRVVATIGDPQSELRRAVSSYRQARLATKVASAIPTFGDVVHWRDLGVFRALAQLPNREAIESALDPRVAALLEVVTPLSSPRSRPTSTSVATPRRLPSSCTCTAGPSTTGSTRLSAWPGSTSTTAMTASPSTSV